MLFVKNFLMLLSSCSSREEELLRLEDSVNLILLFLDFYYFHQSFAVFLLNLAVVNFLLLLLLAVVVTLWARHNLPLVVRRISMISYRKLTWRDIFEDVDIHLGIASTCYMIFLMVRYRWHLRCKELNKQTNRKYIKNFHFVFFSRLARIILTMFLTSVDIFRPIARVSVFVVQKSTDAKLFCCRTVPTRPISRARCFVSENSI